MAHPYKAYQEDRVSRARVSKILKSGDTSAAHEKTKAIYPGIRPGKSTAGTHKIPGAKSAGRFAKGGRVKGHRTNIAIVVPQKASPPTPAAGPQAGAAPPPSAAPAPPMPPPNGGPPMPMRARGGKIKSIPGEATEANIKKFDKRAAGNSIKRARGGRLPTAGAESGVGRLQKAK